MRIKARDLGKDFAVRDVFERSIVICKRFDSKYLGLARLRRNISVAIVRGNAIIDCINCRTYA